MNAFEQLKKEIELAMSEGWTLATLGRAAKIKPQILGDWIKGRTISGNVRTMVKVAKVLARNRSLPVDLAKMVAFYDR